MAARLLDRRWEALAAIGFATAVAFVSALSPLVAIGILLGILLLVVVAAQPLLVLLVLLAVLPWQGMLTYPSETLSVVKLLGFLLAVSFLLSRFRSDRSSRAPALFVPIVVLFMVVVLAMALSPDPGAGVEPTLRFLLFGAFFFLIVQLVDSPIVLRRVLAVLTLSASAASLWGLAAFLAGDVALVSGPIDDPNAFAFFLATVLPIATYLLLEDRHRRWLWAGCFILISAAIFGTLSRGALVGLLAVGLWMIVAQRVRIGGAITAVGAMLAIMGAALLLWSSLIHERVEQKGEIADENVAFRISLWDGAARMAMDRPVLGVGTGRFGEESVDYVRVNPLAIEHPVAHSTYLELLAEAGPIALLAFLAYLVGVWAILSGQARAALAVGNWHRLWLVTALQAALVAAVTAAIFLSAHFAAPFWLIGALAVALLRLGDLGASAVNRR